MAGVNFFIILHYSLIRNETNRKSRSAFFFSDVFILVDFWGFLKIAAAGKAAGTTPRRLEEVPNGWCEEVLWAEA